MTETIDVQTLDWANLRDQLNTEGFAVSGPVLSADECLKLRGAYDDPSTDFRSTVVMARYGFGRGEYKYFADPAPALVETLRMALYPPLSAIANDWEESLGKARRWPRDLSELKAMCRAAGQTRPTSLLLTYGRGDYNCLHQDLYGAVHFPLQVIFLLSAPGKDFSGGELVLVEQRPRMQSRPMIVPLVQGACAVIPVRERPKLGRNGIHRTQMRHGVSMVRSGERRTLGLIFHDAA